MKASEAATKWNIRYTEEPGKYNAPVRKLLLDHAYLIPPTGQALEIAGGFGVSADHLQRNGLQVLELDISWQALVKAKKKNADVFHITADANHFPFGDIKFDIICNFYFFERSLVPQLIQHLKPGGVIFFETLTTAMLTIRPEIPPEYLLLPGELKEAFHDLEIIHYFEGWTNSDHAKQKSIGSLVARKSKTSV